MRQKELELLMQRIHDDLDDGLAAVKKAHRTSEDVGDDTVERVALNVLASMSTSQKSMSNASRTLALALIERGSSPTRVARAAGVSRAALAYWQKDADRVTPDDVMPDDDPESLDE